MTLREIENKLRKRLDRLNDYDRDCFLTRGGIRLSSMGLHDIACNSADTTLVKYIKAGGCRIKCKPGKQLAIETGQALTDRQMSAIIEIIKSNEFEYVAYCQHDTGKLIKLEDWNCVKPYQFTRAFEHKTKKKVRR